MPDYAFVIALVVFIAVAVVAFKVLQGVLKAVVVLIALAAIITGVLGFLVVMDANDLKKGLQEEKSLFLLSDSGTVISGIEVQGSKITSMVPQQQLLEYSGLLEQRDLQQIRADNYKLVIIDAAARAESEANGARR